MSTLSRQIEESIAKEKAKAEKAKRKKTTPDPDLDTPSL
mgnify:FL=1|tara:strand:+ start:1027 stop:1143 length:117 start_codon:yes stop_codon:yes gene_type:complete